MVVSEGGFPVVVVLGVFFLFFYSLWYFDGFVDFFRWFLLRVLVF